MIDLSFNTSVNLTMPKDLKLEVWASDDKDMCGPSDSLGDIFRMQDLIADNSNPVDMPVEHFFAPHLYLRKINMPAGTLVVGKMHKTEHLNILMSGKCAVRCNGATKIYKAGDIFISTPGIKKVLYVIEDTVWLVPHVTDETDLDKIEQEVIYPEDRLRDSNKQMLVDDTEVQKLLGEL